LCDHAPINFGTRFDADLTIGDVTVYVCAFVQFDRLSYKHVSDNAPAHNQTLRVNIALHNTCQTDRQAYVTCLSNTDITRYAPINPKTLRSNQLAMDFSRLPNDGLKRFIC